VPLFRLDVKVAVVDDSMLTIDDMAGERKPLRSGKLDSKLFEIKISMLPLSNSADTYAIGQQSHVLIGNLGQPGVKSIVVEGQHRGIRVFGGYLGYWNA
jgi:hypothetical protein